MKINPLIPPLVLLIVVSARVNADTDRLNAVTAGSAGSHDTESGDRPAAKPPFTTPAVPGRTHRDQAPPAYRIQRDYGGNTNAFPTVPGTGFRNYSRPTYRSR